MKIAIVVSSITKGSGLSKYVCSLLNILSSANSNIMVITTHGINPQDEENILAEYGHCKYINLAGCNKLKKYYKLAKLLRNFSPDVLIINYNGVAQYILPFLPKSIKKIHILHNDTDDFYRIGSINAKYVDGWIAPTKGIADNFNKYTGEKYAEKVTVIPHGVESNENPCHRICDIIRIVFVGVLYEHKGAHLLPKIAQRLKDNDLKFHLTIIGGGVLTEDLKSQFKDDIDLGIVEMTGVISPSEVYRHLSNSDIFLYPTHLDAFGLVIAEAMISGAVPIVTLLPGITDNLIVNGQSGFLIEKDNVEEFVEKIMFLSGNLDKMNEMKINAKDRASSSFSLDRMQKNYLNYLKNL